MEYHYLTKPAQFVILVTSGKLADEFHFILKCKATSTLRKAYLAPRYCRAPNILKFKELMSCPNLKTLKTISIFISKIFELVGCPT